MMQRQKWSVNALSIELARDRRTVARYLDDVEPAAQGPKGPLFWLRDAVEVLFGGPQGEGIFARFAEELDEALHPERVADGGEPALAALDLPGRLCRATTVAGVERVLFEAVLAFAFQDFTLEEPDLRDCTAAQIRRAFDAYLADTDLDEVLELLKPAPKMRRLRKAAKKGAPAASLESLEPESAA